MMFAAATLAALVSFAAIPIRPARAAQLAVTVGGPGGVVKFDPPFVNASVGDTVIFTFQQKNHTATQSTLANPCQPMTGGFDSGFVPVADDATDFPVAEFEVTDENPVWVYCRQANHCQQGMVFAINPADKLAQFQQAATSSANSTNSTSTASATASATSSAASSTSTSTDHFVVVGGPGKLYYNPSNISAQVGDTITFQFQQKNHTVTQSSFAAPCQALASTSGNAGFDSGFVPVADGATSFPTWTVQVNDTNPIWAYCRQSGHCGQGMVFSANAVESGTNNFAAFQAKAKQLNGTSSSSSAAPGAATTTGAGSNGASAVGVSRSVGFAVALTAVVFGLVL